MGWSGPGLTPGVSRNGPQKWKKAQQVNHQVEREAGWPDGRTVQGVSTTPKVKIKMKKLMIALAAAGLVGVASADCTDPVTPTPANCAAVYNVKVSLKTLNAKSKKYVNKAECDDPVTGVNCYLVAGTRKYAGVLASCECDCADSTIVSEPKFYFWGITEKTGYCDATAELANAVRFGGATDKASKKVAATITLTSDPIALNGAGFGTYNAKIGRVSSISGSISGLVNAPVCPVKCEDPKPAYGFSVCASEKIEGITAVPAYGTWSIKYNASASKKYAANSTYVETKMLPSYYVKDCNDPQP